MARLCSLLVLMLMSQLSVISAGQDVDNFCPRQCPTFWTAWGEYCYRYFGYDKLTWHDARARCLSFNSTGGGQADLVSIHSRAEQDFVYHYWRSSRNYIPNPDYLRPALWIGLTDHESEGTFKWSDGTCFDYQNWGRGEPNNALGAEHYVDILDYGIFVNTWNDLPPNFDMNFMCKMAK